MSATDTAKLPLIDDDTNTTYTAGTNVAISGSNVISSTDTDTTYTAGTNVTIDGSNVISSTDTNTDTTYTAGTNVAISGSNVISSTDTNTTYSVQDGGLTQKNFTTTLKDKLDGIEASADVTDATNVAAAGALMDSDATVSETADKVVMRNSSGDINARIATISNEVRVGVGGSDTDPAITFSSDGDTGIWRNASGSMKFVGNGSHILTMSSSSVDIKVDALLDGDAIATEAYVDANAGGGGANTIEFFTSSGNYTVPAGTNEIMITASGGGGGGGGTNNNNGAQGGQGGEGAVVVKSIYPVTAGSTYAVTIGSGGSGGNYSGSGGNDGSSGSTTSFGSLITLSGGGGGGRIDNPNYGAGGAGGSVGGNASATEGLQTSGAAGNQSGSKNAGNFVWGAQAIRKGHGGYGARVNTNGTTGGTGGSGFMVIETL